jgi:uncharacterized protein YbjT (DUF2867 family)
MTLIAVTGASGKTGWRVVQEAIKRGYDVRAIVRPHSAIPAGLNGADICRLELGATEALHAALAGCDGLVIATGARPSVDLFGPMKVDAFGVRDQLRACQAVGLRRVVLVSSLCAGRWKHPLNLFGLILIWKRLGEQWLEQSNLDVTVVRPGGLSENEADLEKQGIRFTRANRQDSNSIPRRLVATVCLDALESPAAIGEIIEITSSPTQPAISLRDWLAGQAPG